MTFDEVIGTAHAQGCSVGQVALAEFILATYAEELSPMLTNLLQKVCNAEYDHIAENIGKPAEDVALSVSRIMEARLA